MNWYLSSAPITKFRYKFYGWCLFSRYIKIHYRSACYFHSTEPSKIFSKANTELLLPALSNPLLSVSFYCAFPNKSNFIGNDWLESFYLSYHHSCGVSILPSIARLLPLVTYFLNDFGCFSLPLPGAIWFFLLLSPFSCNRLPHFSNRQVC
jgi:hypothetical protein